MKIHEPNNLTELENIVALASRRERTEAAILGSVALVGFLSAVALAPNAVTVLRHAIPDTRPLSHTQSVRRAIGRLIKKGYIKKVNDRYKLTKKGHQRLDTLLYSVTLHTNVIGKKQKWDKKWRIVIFDIKESRRHTRDELRNLLNRVGFVKLQDSVWVYPFRCDEVVALLKFKLTLGWDLIYIIADAIEGDEKLKKYFNIS